MDNFDLNSIGPVDQLPDYDYVAQALVLQDPNTAPWPPKLAFDIAMGGDPSDLKVMYELSEDEYFRIINHPAFRREVSEHAKEIRENGVSFRTKAKIFAETYLAEVDSIVANNEIAATTRLDAIKSVVKWAGLEPQVSREGANSSSPQFNIQINL